MVYVGDQKDLLEDDESVNFPFADTLEDLEDCESDFEKSSSKRVGKLDDGSLVDAGSASAFN